MRSFRGVPTALALLLTFFTLQIYALPSASGGDIREKPKHKTSTDKDTIASSFIPLDVSIVNAPGQDISHHIQVRHYHYASSLELSHSEGPTVSSPSTSLKKRAFSRVIDQCPPGPNAASGRPDFVWKSECAHNPHNPYYNPSAKEWSIYCGQIRADGRSTAQYVMHGECEANEICVNGPLVRNAWRPPGLGYDINIGQRARCVSQDFYVRLSELGANEPDPSVIQSAFQALPGLQYGFEATLVNQDSTQVVIADSVEIQPLKSDGTPTGPVQKCNDCTEIGIDWVPQDSSRITVNVGVLEALGEVRLYLTTIPASDVAQSLGASNNTTMAVSAGNQSMAAIAQS